ncbi:choline dehydrogenase-like flavoprotein [Pseudarthrobacter sp. PvP004]|uniref:GMC oxidoreductase n=1 Tax=Pseudarthrobacter sp. PvP004 TaxID=2817850 RepID=UPI001AE6C9B4|nr:GMC oxidoreductase [Pseudarthrobacter sp. PvP004]MBP2266178.1 choline dehydrogenase-like flavoprotein [Pseudarthrobacter sp. PvP004]
MTMAQGQRQRVDEPVTLPQRAGAVRDAAEKFFHRPGLFLVEGQRVPEEQSGLPAASATQCVGGMATQWTAACPRPRGSEVIPFIDPKSMDAAFDRAEKLLDVSNQQLGLWSEDPVGQVIAELFNAGRTPESVVQSMPLAVTSENGHRKWSGMDTVLGDTVGSPGFELLANTRCTRVIMDGRTARGVEVVDEVLGAVRQIFASNVVITAGSLHGPQLLFASGIRPRALGRYLNDHHMIVGAVAVPRRSSGNDESLIRSGTDVVSGVTWIPFDDDVLPLHGQIMHTDASPVAVTGNADAGMQVISLGWFAAKDIQDTDRMEFSETETDSYGMPWFTIHYELTQRDRELIQLAKEKTSLMADALGSSIYSDDAYLMPAGFSLHYQGTMRMGPVDDGTSTCDATSRVWNTENVFVGGNGVIPTATACNPTLTSVALAVLGADEIVRRMGPYSAS